MPCVKCSNGKWRFGSSKCTYTSLENCKKAEQAYYANKENDGEPFDQMDRQRKDISSDYSTK